MTAGGHCASGNIRTAEQLLSSNYKDLGSPPEVGKRFLRFLLENDSTLAVLQNVVVLDHLPRDRRVKGAASITSADDVIYEKEDVEGRRGGGSDNRDLSLEIDAFDLIRYDPVLGHMLLCHPSMLLPVLKETVNEAQRVLRSRIALALRRSLAASERAKSGGSPTETTKSTTKKARRRYADDRDDDAVNLLRNLENYDAPHKFRKVHARLVHLPPHSSRCKPTISSIVSSDMGTIIQLSGTVVRTSPIRMMEESRGYRCTTKGCGEVFTVNADFQTVNNALPTPTICPGSSMGECTGTKFQVIPGGSVHADYQEVKIQESASRLQRVGSIPRSILLKLTHDLVDVCQPGDEIVVVGVVVAQWHPVTANLDCHVTMAIQAHSVRVVNTENDFAERGDASALAMSSGNVRDKFRREFDAFWHSPEAKARPIAARDYVVRAVCPKLYGMHIIKLGLLLTLIGGSNASDVDGPAVSAGDPLKMKSTDEDEEPEQFQLVGSSRNPRRNVHGGSDGHSMDDEASGRARNGAHKGGAAVQSRRRAQSHILLVGDPGTGKSQFLRFAAALSPRSVLTTGTGCSSAGLTCAAVRENASSKEFTLEAGALVLADRGVCCIDEFGCIREEDRTTIHEAMEQQTISVAKAGIVCKLNSRATVVAVMNPRGALYETGESVEKNTNIGSPLLSRFDLIFVMLDQSDGERDQNIARFLLNHAIQPGSGYEASPHYLASIGADDADGTTTEQGHWSMEKLRAYIATVKERFHPTLSPDAVTLLERHYAHCRNMRVSSVQITVRFLESLIRLSQAHARLMYRDTVELQDAAAAILIMECSAATSKGLDGTFAGNVQDCLFRQPMQTDFRPHHEVDPVFDEDERILLARYNMLDRRGYNIDNRGGTWNAPCTSQPYACGGEAFNPSFKRDLNSCAQRTHEAYSQNWRDERKRPSQESHVDCYGRTHFLSPRSANTQRSIHTQAQSQRQDQSPVVNPGSCGAARSDFGGGSFHADVQYANESSVYNTAHPCDRYECTRQVQMDTNVGCTTEFGVKEYDEDKAAAAEIEVFASSQHSQSVPQAGNAESSRRKKKKKRNRSAD